MFHAVCLDNLWFAYVCYNPFPCFWYDYPECEDVDMIINPANAGMVSQ